ncbi:MAG: DinB family protein [Cyclobacteriaceae bacterium]|nr:DinB family protein [Cyclobacteriaceae bacterium]
MESIKNINKLVQRIYNGKAWHGPSILEVLKDVNESNAQKKAGNSHSIVQLVMHMVAWRTFVTKRLLGDSTFELSDDQNFPKETNWATALKALEESQAELVNVIDSLDANRLQEIVSDRKYDFFVLLHGVIHHDIYHIGQIQLIKKYL